MNNDEKLFIIAEVQGLLENNFEAFSLEDIIDCSEELTPEQVEWAKENLEARVVIIHEEEFLEEAQ